MEGMYRESEQRKSPELQELLEHPHEVFDSTQEKAEEEHKKVRERLANVSETAHFREGVELQTHAEHGGGAPTIDIAWQVPGSKYGSLLQLTPIQEGKGVEGAVFGYTGRYGLAARFPTGAWRYADAAMLEQLQRQNPDMQVPPNIPVQQPLEQLLGVPQGLQLAIKPTVTRWAVGQDELAIALGENTRTLHMGLGLLLLPYGERYMIVGMHEAGHLDSKNRLTSLQRERPEENRAWQVANAHYAQSQRGNKADVLAGDDPGLFSLLTLREIEKFDKTTQTTKTRKKIDTYWPSARRIMAYGLVSHHLADVETKATSPTFIPESWKGEGNIVANDLMRGLKRDIERAENAYNYFVKK